MRFILPLLFLTASVRAAASPATPPASAAAVNARAAMLVEQGYSALRDGDGQAALESFLDAKNFWSKQNVKNDVNDPLMYADLSGVGAAYLALGHNEKANDPLDRAYAAAHKEKSLIVNRAALDYVQHVNVQRGTRELVELLSRPGAPADDEATLNVLGACLQYSTLDPNLTRGTLYQKASDLYAKLDAALEAKRPGRRRWGPEWVREADFTVKAAKLQRGKDKYREAVQTRDDASAAVTAATAELDHVKRMVGNRRSDYQQSLVDNATVKVNQANEAFVNAREAVPVAFKAIPWPEWPKSFPPQLPDSVGGGTFGSPAVLVVAPVAPAATPVEVAVAVKPAAPAPAPAPPAEAQPPAPAAPPAAPPARTISRYAVAFPVGADLLLTAAAPLENATDVVLESSQGTSIKATIVRTDAAVGLVLLKAEGQQFRYLNLASAFNGGPVTCWSFPDVSIFNPASDAIEGKALGAQADKWTVSLRRHPRLAGGPLIDKSGALIGVELGERDAVMTQIKSIRPDDVRKFLGEDLPKSACANPDPSAVWQVTASRTIQ